MPDNYQADDNTTAGVVFASDEVIGGPTGDAHWPYAKMAFGPNGSNPVIVQDTVAGALPVKVRNEAATVVSGQVSVGTTATAFSSVAARRFTLKASQSNTDTIAIGPATVTMGNGFLMFPGDELPIEITNLNVMQHIAGSAGQTLSYIGEV